MSWTPTPIIQGAPSLKFAPHDDVKEQQGIYNKLYYKIFTEEVVWDSWTAWINDVNNHATEDMLKAAEKFSPYAI